MNTRHVGDGEGDHHVSASCRQVFEAIVDANDFQPRVYRLDGRRTDGAVDTGSRSPSHQDSQSSRWRGHWSIPFQHGLCLSGYSEAIPRWAAGPISWRYPLRLSKIWVWACRPTPPAGAVPVVESPAKTGSANRRDQNPWLPERRVPATVTKATLAGILVRLHSILTALATMALKFFCILLYLGVPDWTRPTSSVALDMTLYAPGVCTSQT